MSETTPEAPVDGVEPDATDPAEGGETPDAPGIPFRALLIQEGVETSDDRLILPNALTWRQPPVPLMVQLKSDHGGMGDTAASVGGRIDTITREPGPTPGTFDIVGVGVFDAEGEIGIEAARLVAGKFLLGVSADLAVTEAEDEITAVDEDGWPIGKRFIVTAGELGMATVTPFPAFGECQIELTDPEQMPADPLAVPEMPQVGDRIPVIADGGQREQSFTFTMADGCVPCEQRGTVVAAGGPLAPPAAWFTDPQLDGPTPPTVTPEGRVFGHIAPFRECHTGSPSGACTVAPQNADYSFFETGSLVTEDGSTIPVGQLTLAGGHADLRLGYRAAAQHYDDTDSAIADVRVGEDAHGVWFAGGLRPGVTDEQIRVFLASPLSGDWRPIGGKLRMIAACSVNVQGFPIVRALAASGQTMALVASTGLSPQRLVVPEDEIRAQVAAALPPDVVYELHQWRLEREAERALAHIDRLTL